MSEIKTPEDVKKGLECCTVKRSCKGCPYYAGKKLDGQCILAVEGDSLRRIQQLESTYSQLNIALCGKDSATLEEILQAVDQINRERDALMEEVRGMKGDVGKDG